MASLDGLQSIAKIFSKKIFRIPDYQRGYSWQKKQLDDFWEDLSNIQQDRPHYTGVLTLEKIAKKDYKDEKKWERDRWLLDNGRGYEPFYIVDGQQRITTIIILISVLLDAIKEEKIDIDKKEEIEKQYIYVSNSTNTTYIFGYEIDDPSDIFLRACVLGEETEIINVKTKTLYTNNLSYANNFFTKKISDLSDSDRVKLYQKITNFLVFNVYIVEDDIDVSVAFETMNNRGIPLSKLELLKNRLIYLTTKSSNGEQETQVRKEINDCWKTIYGYLGKKDLGIKDKLKDDTFLKDHWIMYFGKYNRSEENAYAIFLLDNHFILGNFSSTTERRAKLGLSDIQTYVKNIGQNIKHWFEIYYPEYNPYMSVDVKEWLLRLDDLNRGAFVPLIMATMFNNINDNDLLKLLKSMERYMFLVFKVSQRKSNAGNSRIYAFAYEAFKKPRTINNICNEIDDMVFMKSGMYNSGFYDISSFNTLIKDYYVNNESGKKGYLGWSKIKYFLCEYELYLRQQKVGNPILMSQLSEITEVKYISKLTYKYDLTPQQKQYITYSLGNLVLTGKDMLNELEVQNSGEWTPDKVLQRGIKMLKFFEERWQVPIGDEEDMKKLLFLNVLK